MHQTKQWLLELFMRFGANTIVCLLRYPHYDSIHEYDTDEVELVDDENSQRAGLIHYKFNRWYKV